MNVTADGRVRSPKIGTTVYYYDSAGNLTKRVAATGVVMLYTFDAPDRVLTMTFPSNSAEIDAFTSFHPLRTTNCEL